MMHQPRFSPSTFEILRDLAYCSECHGILDFSTDLNGYVIEYCLKCRKSRPMTIAKAKPQLVKPPVVESWPCPDCGSPIGWTGNGMKRRRCNACQVKRDKLSSREWHRKRYVKVQS